MKTSPYLQLDSLHMDKKVMNLLSPELAHRFHALPVAVDGSRITVAMANPEDSIAREWIVNALGPDTCIVQADPQVVDLLIRELWPENPQPPLQMMCWSPAGEETEGFKIYIQSLIDLLGANLRSMKSSQSGIHSIRDLYRAMINSKMDLVVLQNPDQPLMKRLILDLVDYRFLDRMPASVLIVTREKRWPIQKILLVVKSEDNDQAAVEWAILLAHLAKARVTILPQIPVPPLMFASLHHQLNPGNLLVSTCPLGKRLREIIDQLNRHDVQGTLRIRHEPIDQQVQSEILENQYDVIVVGANPQNLVQHWVIGETINPLLHWANVPILLAKPSKRIRYES